MEEEYLAAEEQFFIFQDFFDFTTIIDYLKCDVINKYNKSVDEGVKWLISLLDENLIIICKKNPARNRFCYITECIFAKREDGILSEIIFEVGFDVSFNINNIYFMVHEKNAVWYKDTHRISIYNYDKGFKSKLSDKRW